MNTNTSFQSKLLKMIIIALSCIIVLIFIFWLGVIVGNKRADFSFRWAEQYHRNFAGPQEGFLGNFMQIDKEFTDSNGAFGQIIKISDGSFTVRDRNNVEKTILIGKNTTIICRRQNIKLLELLIGDDVVVIGEPNNVGQITAQLVRVMPPPPMPQMTNPRCGN